MFIFSEDEVDFPVHQPVEENEMLLPEPDGSEVPPDSQGISIEIYDNYKFDHVYDNSLPITLEQERVLQTIETNRVTVVQGKIYTITTFGCKSIISKNICCHKFCITLYKVSYFKVILYQRNQRSAWIKT